MSKSDFPKSVPIFGRVRVCLEILKNEGIKDKVIVNVGSSFGWLEKEIEGWGAKKVIGVEPNEEAVEFAKRSSKTTEFMVADALNTTLPSNVADVVLLLDVIEHVPKGTEDQVLSEMARILKRGGKLLLSTPNWHLVSNVFDLAWYFGHRHYTKEKLSQILKKAGFKILDIESRGSFFSSFYLSWFYVAKRLFNTSQPRSNLLEKLDDQGYQNGKITDIFAVCQKTN